MTDNRHGEVERLSTILARQAEERERRILSLTRDGLTPLDDFTAATLEMLETRQVVSSWRVRSLMVRVFQAGAKYQRDRDADGGR